MRGQIKVKEMAGNAAVEITQFKANTMFSLTTQQIDVVKEVGCSSTIGHTLNPKKKQTQFGERSDEEDDGKVGINLMLQREVTHDQKRNTKQVQQKKTEDHTVCEFDKVYDGIEEGRKIAVAAKLGKNKELNPQDKQTEVEDKKKQEVESHLQKSENQV